MGIINKKVLFSYMITTFILVNTQNQKCAFLPGAPKLDPNVQLTPPCVQLWRRGPERIRQGGGGGGESKVVVEEVEKGALEWKKR